MLFVNIYNMINKGFYVIFVGWDTNKISFVYSLKVLILLFDILYILCYDTHIEQDSKTIYIFLGGCYHVR